MNYMQYMWKKQALVHLIVLEKFPIQNLLYQAIYLHLFIWSFDLVWISCIFRFDLLMLLANHLTFARFWHPFLSCIWICLPNDTFNCTCIYLKSAKTAITNTKFHIVLRQHGTQQHFHFFFSVYTLNNNLEKLSHLLHASILH